MSFSDPIEAAGALILDSLHSPNYVAGSAGWSINKDGSSEFSDSVVRGMLQVGGTLSKVTIHQIGSDAVIELTDQNGLGYKFQADTVAPSSLNIQSTTPNSPSIDVVSSGAPGGNNGAVLFTQSATFHGVLFDNGDGWLKRGGFGGGTYAADGFDATTSFFNGWTDWGAPFAPARGIVLPTGMAYVQGTLRPGTTGVGILVFRKSSKYSPQTGTVRIPCAEGPGTGTNGSAWLDITKNSGLGTTDYTLTSGAVGSLSFSACYPIM